MVNQFQRLACLLGCCVYLKIIRAREAAHDDGGLHIGGQIRQWTTITDQRGTMVRGLIFCRQRVYFYLFFVLVFVTVLVLVFVSVFASEFVF